ncbi:hypothetical protein GDO81_010921 [Engystomops pustulosus]|uniref:Uncharacterized protein n=1 Tax=Engystomops pustulosus TaxID=76066 RepID=A0AAV7C3N9_ENGPU|nr:hypothetical protein GDO81_010921 [Engystomops pustulosus]
MDCPPKNAENLPSEVSPPARKPQYFHLPCLRCMWFQTSSPRLMLSVCVLYSVSLVNVIVAMGYDTELSRTSAVSYPSTKEIDMSVRLYK